MVRKTLRIIFLTALTILFMGTINLAPAFRISSPEDEAIIRPGGSVTIRVEPAPSETIRSVLFGFGELKSPPWEAKAKVPLKTIGLIEFSVVGFVKDATGNRDAEDFITLNVVPDTPLTDLGAGFNGRFLTVGGLIKHIDVTGVFADGITRDLTNFQERIDLIDEYGITFTSSDPTVVAVGKLGYIQGLKTGKAIITVKGVGGVQTTVPVDASPSTFADPKAPSNHSPVAVVGSDLIVQSGSTFTLDGSRSSDPD